MFKKYRSYFDFKKAFKKHFNVNQILNAVLLLIVVILLVGRIPMWWAQYQMEGKNIKSVIVKNLKLENVEIPKDILTPSVLIFWAEGCLPCKIEMARYQKAIDEKELDPEKIIGVFLGTSPEAAQKIYEENKYTFKAYIDDQFLAATNFEVQGTPTVIHLNDKAEIKWVSMGISPTAIYRAKSLLASGKTETNTNPEKDKDISSAPSSSSTPTSPSPSSSPSDTPNSLNLNSDTSANENKN